MEAQEPKDGERYGAELRITRDAETEEDGGIREPADRYWDGNGKEYRLDSWEIVTIPGQDVSRHLERKMVYTGVEGAEEIPGSISQKEDVAGNQAEGIPIPQEKPDCKRGVAGWICGARHLSRLWCG